MNWSSIPIALEAIWLLWLGQAAWSCFNAWNFLHRAKRLQRRFDRRNRKAGFFTPPAAVIIPVKGAGDHFQEHVLALGRQDYPGYRLIFVVQSEEDPAYAALRAIKDRVGREVEVLVAGLAGHGGQKVHNQLCGLQSLRPSDEVAVFADADAVPHDQWLRQLVAPLRREFVGASTGYRWLVPADENASWASCFASVLNASVATLLGPPRRNHAWGGSMALTRRMLDQSRLVEHWQGALSDDYQLTHAIGQTDKIIQFAPRCLVVSPARFTWRSLLEFARRQYLITRIHEPWIWLAGLLITALYTAGWVSVITAGVMQTPGWHWGWAIWASVFALDHWRAQLRRRAVHDLLGPQTVAKLHRVWLLEHWATPLWMLLHLAIILSSTAGRRITWAGITYDMRHRQDVRIVRREEASMNSEKRCPGARPQI